MTAGHYARVVRAELFKVFTRPMGIANLVVALAVGVLVALFLDRLDHADGVRVMDKTLAEMITPSAVSAGGWALWARCFFVQPLFLILVSTTAIASEHADRTLREVLARPVPRWAVLSSRIAAIAALASLTLLLTFVGSMGVGIPMFGFPQTTAIAVDSPSIPALLLGYTVAILGDVALITWTVALSLLVRSAGMVVVALAVLLLLDFGVTAMLMAASAVGLEAAQTALPWTIYSVLHAWQGYEQGWNAQLLVALLAYTLGGAALAWWRFERLDAP